MKNDIFNTTQIFVNKDGFLLLRQIIKITCSYGDVIHMFGVFVLELITNIL